MNPWLYELPSCDSTNTWAINNSASLHHGDVVFTRNQTAGRGQYNRPWYSPQGVLTASFVIDGVLHSKRSGLSLAVGLGVIYAVEDLLPQLQGKLRLKWPNDVMLAGGKLAGILCESSSSNTRVVVGVGLNRCVDFGLLGLDTQLKGNAISLHQVCSPVPEELSLLERSRHYLLEVADIFSRNTKTPEKGSIDIFLPELHKRDFFLNEQVVLNLAQEEIKGKAVGFDSWGRLLVELKEGTIRAFASGNIIKQGDLIN